MVHVTSSQSLNLPSYQNQRKRPGRRRPSENMLKKEEKQQSDLMMLGSTHRTHTRQEKGRQDFMMEACSVGHCVL